MIGHSGRVRDRVAKTWRWATQSIGRRVATALLLGSVAAIMVLAFDVRARVGGEITYCGNGAIGVDVPLFEDPSRSFYDECGAAIRRRRVGAAGTGVAVFVIAAGLTEMSARRRPEARS